MFLRFCFTFKISLQTVITHKFSRSVKTSFTKYRSLVPTAWFLFQLILVPYLSLMMKICSVSRFSLLSIVIQSCSPWGWLRWESVSTSLDPGQVQSVVLLSLEACSGLHVKLTALWYLINLRPTESLVTILYPRIWGLVTIFVAETDAKFYSFFPLQIFPKRS